MKKAFTLVEVMIVVVIIGLLAAMAIPAFQKVKVNTIAKEVIAEHYVSYKDMDYLKSNIASVNSDLRSQLPTEIGGGGNHVTPTTNTDNYQVIVIDGKVYKLVPQK